MSPRNHTPATEPEVGNLADNLAVLAVARFRCSNPETQEAGLGLLDKLRQHLEVVVEPKSERLFRELRVKRVTPASPAEAK
jgi:hypothetical protein